MSSEESSLLIQEYYKNPQYKKRPEFFCCSSGQWNSICGDNIVVYLDIQNEKIQNYGYDGEPALTSTAAAEFLAEFIIGANIKEVLERDAKRIKESGFEVSYRRIRSSVSALLATRNTIHIFLKDGIIDEYEDLIE